MKKNGLLIFAVAVLAGAAGWVLRGGPAAQPADRSDAVQHVSSGRSVKPASALPRSQVSEMVAPSDEESVSLLSHGAERTPEEALSEQRPGVSAAVLSAAEPADPNATVWELDPGVRVPAVIAESDVALTAVVAAANEQILRDFEEAVSQTENSPNAGAATEVSEKIWDGALRQADEAYRALHGDSGFNSQGVKNARDALDQAAVNP